MAVFAVVGLTVIPPVWSGSYIFYGGTDDVRMEMIAAGIGNSSGPSEYLQYSHMLIGSTLSRLYRIVPNVPWYPVYLLITIVVSQGVAAWVFARLDVNRMVRLLLFAFLVTIGFYFWTQLRFTAVAVACALSGLLLIQLSIIRDDRDGRFPSAMAIIGWWLVLFAGMIRFQAAMMMAGMMAVPGLCLLCTERHHVRVGRHVLIAVAGLAVLCGNEFLHHTWYSTSTEWSEFREMHDTTASIVNTRRIRHLFMKNTIETLPEAGRDVLAETGLSFNDAQTMICWYFADADAVPVEKLKTFWSSLRGSLVLSSQGFAGAVARVVERIAASKEMLLFFVLSGLALTVSRCRWIRVTLALLIWASVLSAMLALEFLMKLPDDVMLSLGCVAVTGSLVVTVRRTRSDDRSETETETEIVSHAGADPDTDSSRAKVNQVNVDRPRLWAQTLMIIGLIAALAVNCLNIQLTRRAQVFGAQLRWDMDPILKDRSQLYVIALPFPFNLLPVLDHLDEWREFRFVYLDGFQRSPHFQATLKTAGINNLTKAIIRGEVKLIIHPFQVKVLQRFIEEHYGDWIRREQIQGGAIQFRRIGTGNGFEVWKTYPQDDEPKGVADKD